jgi:plasmid maintenance system antidote protein VapI
LRICELRKDRLEQTMRKRGYNPSSLAETVGRSERNIWRLLNEGANTSEETLLALAKALDVSSDYLLGLSDDPTPHMRIDNLTDEERAILIAVRRGEKLAAINLISSSGAG